ncbi:MAG: polyprenyl synthetase family protein [Deltaproteobacteria bacterium]|jgi:octaprenyl-diphosphate synthase|nr:polyprenyl synthetase family protein [Deltaproteobacteria bacterium]
MLKLKNYLKDEEQRISDHLKKEILTLDPVVQPMVEHTLSAGGKRIRPFLTVLFGKLFGYTDPAVYSLASAVEFIHSATLIHDDIIDAADTRRGSPAAHLVFGAPQALLAGDVLLSAAMLLALRLNNYKVMECCATAVARTAAGQLEETQNLRNPYLPFEDYLHIITGKTAYLISCACESGAILAGASVEHCAAAAEFGLQIGIVFQLVDDALDIAPESEIGKPSGGDLREGKFTPLLHFYLQALQAREATNFAAKFAAGTLDEAELAAALADMRRLGCDARTRALADRHLTLAEAALERLPAGTERDLLAKVAAYVRTRKL